MEMKPVVNAMTAVTVLAVDTPARTRVKSSRPPVSSRTEMRTVTPQTIMMTRQGISLTAADSSPALNSARTMAQPYAPSPTLTSKRMTPTSSMR